MTTHLALFGLAALVLAVGWVFYLRVARLSRELAALRVHLLDLEARLTARAGRIASERAGTPSPPPAVAPAATAAPIPAVPPLPQVPPAIVATSEREGSSADFVSSLGPRILVATGALAFVVFLGFFVKYAWENEWVGPAGRVWSGAALSLVLVAAGVRLLDREYRPLGQGLAAAGLAGLYVAGYGAHAFYELISRGLAGLLMLLVTTASVLLAVRLETRLLALLAWAGAYLVPFLLSSGEDRALSLYAYLLLLALGALWLDRARPWPETAPLAIAGTIIAYGGWHLEHYRAERFGVALLGLVLFGALFGVAMALRSRLVVTSFVALALALGLAVLAEDHDGARWVAVSSVAGAFAMAHLARRLDPTMSFLGLVIFGVPCLAWMGFTYEASRQDPGTFALTAVWLLAGAAAFASPDRGQGALRLCSGLALAFAASGAAQSGTRFDQARGLLVLLLGLVGVAALLRARVPWAEVVGAAGAAATVWAWFDTFHAPGRGQDALVLALPVALAYLLAVAMRVLLAGAPLGAMGLCTHLLAAALLIGSLHRVLAGASPGLLASLLVAFAGVYAVLGAASSRVRPADKLAAGCAFGLAIAFLTLAVPAWLGLHAITAAWALEGTLLLWLGARHRSAGIRLAGHLVQAVAVARLCIVHLPVHDGDFSPVWNAAFGTWLFVIACLGTGLRLTRSLRAEGESDDGWVLALASGATAGTALGLLFLVLSVETHDSFQQWARVAEAAGRLEDARFAQRAGGLGLSVLWTGFATALLAGGLLARSRALFYVAYALFGMTALKVVWVDLATYPTSLRMFSFLALAVLLMVGAYLNLRFRARLAHPEATPDPRSTTPGAFGERGEPGRGARPAASSPA